MPNRRRAKKCVIADAGTHCVYGRVSRLPSSGRTERVSTEWKHWETMTTPVEIRTESDRLHAVYRSNFGGLPRLTRDAKLLTTILEQSKVLLNRAPAGRGDLRDTLQARVTLYANELAAVQQDQLKGPYAMAAARVASDANAVFHRYRRHFGGKARWSRDSHLLEELLEELEAAKASFKIVAANWDDASVRDDQTVVDNSIVTYTSEREEIAKSRLNLDENQVVAASAEWANELFGVYRELFGGLPRLSRRPALLARMLQSLREAHAMMLLAKANGSTNESLLGNITVVEGYLEMWEKEHQEIVNARASTDINTLVSELVTEREAIWSKYSDNFAGQSRDTRDLGLLGGLVDRVDELARQARELHRAYDMEETGQLLSTSRDQRVILMREYDAVRDALDTKVTN